MKGPQHLVSSSFQPSWRTEEEIHSARQEELRRYQHSSDPGRGLFPFKNVRLHREDVEWLIINWEVHNGSSDKPEEARFAHQIDLRGADLRGINLSGLPLAGVDLSGAQLQNTFLHHADLRGAILMSANLEGADLRRTHMEGANLAYAHVGGADLREAFFDIATSLRGISLEDDGHLVASVADLHWGGANLAMIDWPVEKLAKWRGAQPTLQQAKEDVRQGRTRKTILLGDEQRIGQETGTLKHPKPAILRQMEYAAALRAYLQLAREMREQGALENANKVDYRAKQLQRDIFRRTRGQKQQYLFYTLLDLLTGFGYRMRRIVVAYVLVICVFAGAYWSLDRLAPDPLTPWEALIVSITAFHGRVFSYNPFKLSNPEIFFTSLEAIIGLLLEAIFIAMLTQRFFNK